MRKKLKLMVDRREAVIVPGAPNALFAKVVEAGGFSAAQIELNLPSATTGLFQGALLFFLLATDVLINFRVVIARPQTLRESAR